MSEIQAQLHHISWWMLVVIDLHWQNPLSHHSGMVGPDCKLLTQVTSFPEIDPTKEIDVALLRKGALSHNLVRTLSNAIENPMNGIRISVRAGKWESSRRFSISCWRHDPTATHSRPLIKSANHELSIGDLQRHPFTFL